MVSRLDLCIRICVVVSFLEIYSEYYFDLIECISIYIIDVGFFKMVRVEIVGVVKMIKLLFKKRFVVKELQDEGVIEFSIDQKFIILIEVCFIVSGGVFGIMVYGMWF